MADGYISQIKTPDNKVYLLKDSEKTDEKVKQTSNTEDKEFPILFKNTNNTTEETAGVKYSGNTTADATTTKPFTFNPNTGNLTVTQLKIGTKNDNMGLFPNLNNWNQIGASNLYWYRSYINNYYGGRSHVDNWDSGKNIGTAANASAAAVLGTVNFYNTAAAGATQTKTLLTADSTANSNITITLPKTTGTLALKSELPTLSGLGGVGTISASGTAPLTLSGSKSGTTYTLTGSIADASASASGIVNTDAQVFGGIKTFMNGIEIKGHIAGDSSTTTGHGLYGGGMYHNAYNNIILHGDASTGSSGIAFVSDKVAADGTITNRNAPSDRAFIQYHACGVTTATTDGTNPTLASGSEEAGRFVIGIGNDSGDKIILQAPGDTDIVHQKGATGYPIPHTTNTNGNAGGTTTPVYVEAGVIKPVTLKDTANALINALDTGSSPLTANDYVITQYVGGGTTTTTYHRRPANQVVNGTLVKAALGTVGTTAKKFLKDTGAWTQVAFSDLSGTATNAQLANSKVTIAGNDVSLGGSLEASTLVTSLGLSKAMRFLGAATVAITDGGTEDPKVGGSATTVAAGDVVIDKDTAREYVWSTAGKWELLGGDESYWVSSTDTAAKFWRGDNVWSDTISGGTLKITNNSNTVTIGSQNVSFTHIYNSASIPFIFNNTILTLSGNLGSTNYPFNNLYLGAKGSRSIYYVGTKATNAMITFLDNTGDAYGNGIKIGGGGTVVVGAGESATNMPVAAGDEILYLTSDGTINIEAGGDTIANRIGMQVTAAGHIIPVKAEAANNNKQNLGASDNRWATIYSTKFNGILTPSSWLDGQRYQNGALNIDDYSNTGSYNPWIRATNTWASGAESAKVGRWFSLGTLGTSFYLMGSASTRTENSYDNALRYDTSNGYLYAAAFKGNADTATTATNLANNPSIQASTSNANQITITAGGKTSSAYTVPYATSANTATTATWVGKGTHSAAITANEFTPAVGTMTVLGNVSNTSMSHSNNANAEIIIKAHPTSGTSYYEARLGFSSNGTIQHMPVNGTTWNTILDSTNYTDYTVTKTGTGASGTWGINISGSAGSVAWANTGHPSTFPPTIGTTSTTAAAGDHTHTISLTQTGTSTVNLAANTVYTLTAGGSSVVFKTPADGNTDTKVNVTATAAAITKNYLLMTSTAPTSSATGHTALGSASLWVNAVDKGKFELVLGNATATTTAGGQFGQLALYSASTAGTYLKAADGTAWKTQTLQAKDGTIALTSDIPTNLNQLTNGPGYTTNTGTVTSVKLIQGAGITVSSSGTAITTTGERTISITGMDTTNGSTTKWLNQKGGWSIPSASDVGALSSSTTVTNVAISADITTNKDYAVVFGTTPSDGTQPTGAKTEGLQKNISKFYFNPYEGNLNATSFSVNESVTLKYNTTDKSLEFIF